MGVPASDAAAVFGDTAGCFKNVYDLDGALLSIIYDNSNGGPARITVSYPDLNDPDQVLDVPGKAAGTFVLGKAAPITTSKSDPTPSAAVAVQWEPA